MQNEKIGAVTLDYRFYPEEDKYSDGSIEDEMLELAKTHMREEFDRIIAEKKSWPILYHFSHIRKNIVEWLPMTGQEHVLEIGAGPGAITGVLAEKAKNVTCIDLSRRRSLINAYRNREHENIRILVGNFQDVAGALEEKFDLITLIGVFEYAQFSIQSDQPFVDYLLEIKRLLAPGGRLVIAIENRLGLKYWAGATEDHTGVYFEGLEGYPTTDYVRTFSRPELEKLFGQAGFDTWQFYYPYPDYKLPEIIYSDRRLPEAGELNRNVRNFDRERVQVFSEERVYNSLIESGLYPLYSNSYLAVIEAPEEAEAGNKMDSADSEDSEIQTGRKSAGQESRQYGDAPNEFLCYAKYSNERAPRFRIRTDILEDRQGHRMVRKRAADLQAGAHVASIYDKYQRLRENFAGTALSVNRCELREDDAYLEWLSGDTLEAELDELLDAGQTDVFIGKIREYFQIFSKGEEGFRETPEFAEVFGRQELLSGMNTGAGQRQAADPGTGWKCRPVSDIDMVFANVIHTEQGYTLIDYEWTFDFPVPVKYLQYRCLHYYALGNPKRAKLLEGKHLNLYDTFGITEQEQKCFEDMEIHFQQYILGDYTPAWKLYDEISEGVIPLAPLIEEESRRRRMQTVEVYFDDGSGFRAENSRQYRAASGGSAQFSIEIPFGTKALRIDPCSERCVVRVIRLEQAGKALTCQTNGMRLENGDYVFDTEDPQIIIPQLSSGTAEVKTIFFTEPLKGIVRDAVLAQEGRIHRMEHTRVWRLYRKVKRLLGKN